MIFKKHGQVSHFSTLLLKSMLCALLTHTVALSSPTHRYASSASAWQAMRAGDLSVADFLASYTSRPPPPPTYFSTNTMYRHTTNATLPAALDWTTKGVVTPVKSQRCGDCWTFSATGALEGAYAIARGTAKLTNFSEQEFVDCVDDGCNGGWNFNALKFAVNHSVCTAESFPCTAKGNGTQCVAWKASPCARGKRALAKGELEGWKSVGGKKWGATTEKDLMSALQHGPVAINMFADSPMGHYHGGVLAYSNCSKGTNHGVLAVGYGHCAGDRNVTTGPCANVSSATGVDYWKVKNSWGASFGVGGYFFLARGVYKAGCGTASILLTNPSFPVMKK